MKNKVECEDSIRLKEKEGRSTREFGLSATVKMESGKTGDISFYQPGWMGSFIYIPVADWGKVKDKVDRLIIRAEELWKED